MWTQDNLEKTLKNLTAFKLIRTMNYDDVLQALCFIMLMLAWGTSKKWADDLGLQSRAQALKIANVFFLC